MNYQEAIEHARDVAKKKYAEGMLCHANPNDEELDGCIECARDHEQLAEWLEELQKYKQIGTLEEVRGAMEKQEGQEPRLMYGMYGIVYECKECGNELELSSTYCPFCGKKQDWGEKE